MTEHQLKDYGEKLNACLQKQEEVIVKLTQELILLRIRLTLAELHIERLASEVTK